MGHVAWNKTDDDDDEILTSLLTISKFLLAELTARQHGQCWRVMETGHPSTRAVNSGRQLG